MESQKINKPQKTDIRRSFSIQWTEKISGEVSEDFINRMSNDEFSFFIKCKLPEKYLRTMRDNLLYIGDEKRMMLLKQITLCKSLGRI